MYRELDIQDCIQRLQIPPELNSLVDESMSLNMTSVPGTGESPDFRLEEINKNVQRFMPLAPRDNDWLNVCANYDMLKHISSSSFKSKLKIFIINGQA